MHDAGVARRLRVSGILAVAVIAALTVVLGAVLEWRFASSLAQADLLNNARLRRAETMAVLYRAALARSQPSRAAELASAVDRLVARQRSVADLSASESAAFEAFVGEARSFERATKDEALFGKLQEDGLELYATFDAHSVELERQTSFQRLIVRNVIIGGLGVILVVLILLYFFVIRRGERAILTAMDEVTEKSQRFEAVFDNSSEILAFYDYGGRLVSVNHTFAGTFGAQKSRPGGIFGSCVAPGALAEAQRQFANALLGEPVSFTTAFVLPDDRAMTAASTLTPIVVNGVVAGVVLAARDVTAEQRYELELRRSRARFRSLFDRNPDSSLAIDANGIITDVNRALTTLLGFEPEDLIGQYFTAVIPPGKRDAAGVRREDLMSGRARTYLAPAYAKDGTEFIVEVNATPIVVDGRVEGVFYTSRDTRQDAIRSRLEAGDFRLKTLIDVASSSWDADSQIGQALQLGTQALGMTYGFVVSMSGKKLTVLSRYGPDDFLSVGETMESSPHIGGMLISSARALAIEDLTVEPYGEDLQRRGLPWKSYIGSRILVDNEPYGALVFLDRNVRTKKFEQADVDFIDVLSTLIASAVSRSIHDRELRARAVHDKLTGMPNRSILEEQFGRMLARARRSGERFAVHYFDLDGFKAINDVYGHAAGDEVLKEVARRFGTVVRGEDIAARVGGDEFIVLASIDSRSRDTGTFVERVRKSLAAPFKLSGGAEVHVGTSAGHAICPDEGDELKELLEIADAAMYRDKESRHGPTL